MSRGNPIIRSGRNLLVQVVAVPAILAAAAVIAALLLWSTSRTDGVSFERQEQLVSLVLRQSISTLAHEQEGSTFSDRAIKILDAPVVDLERIDNNFGTWMHSYYGHDESYMVGRNDQPVYAAQDRRRVSVGEFEDVRSVAMPLVAELRAKMRRLGRAYRSLTIETLNAPGVADVAMVNGHPAIISVKPLLTHTGNLIQTPGKEYVHVAVRRIDGSFLQKLRQDYLFERARFSRSGKHGRTEAALPFTSQRTGRPIGYLVWKPFRPGSAVLSDIALAMLLTLALAVVLVWLLLKRIRRGTSELLASEAQARHLAFHDVLTGLANRALFEERLESALTAARVGGETQAALLFLDLDRFKWVNDTLGHPAGDELIREVARRLSGLLRKGDTAARLGGDEFAVIMNEVRSKRDIDSMCRRIQVALNAPFNLIGSQAHIGVSIGVARAPVDSLDRSELTRKADIALYHAKAAGRRCHRIFDKKMDTTIQYRKRIEHDLRLALAAGDQLEVFYQPQFDSTSMKMVGVEALIRWNHPEMGLLYPATFIPIAEETGLIEQLGEWVLKEAFAAGRRWRELTISVNASAVQLRNPMFAEHVMRISADARFNLARLELEITETSLLENLAQCEANLLALRAKGVRIALDDFGTGYSSLSHLRAFRVDRVKIDRSFVMGLGDASGRAIVQAIVDLAQSSDLQITAEGVETLDQSNFLRAAGCHDLQGFGLSIPLALEDFEDTYILAEEPPDERRAA